MEKKFTKGKWFVSNDNQIVSMPSQCKITNRVSGWNPEEAKANARLIAAAPDLLEALESFVYEIEKTRSDDNILEEFYHLAKEAIKKATE